jgi:hypothetical protein
VSRTSASAFAASVLPTPASPSSSSGCGRRSAKKSAVGVPLAEHSAVVLPGVDVERDPCADRHVDDLVRPAVEQLPDPFVSVQRRELGEDAAPERERVAAAVVVEAGGKRSLATPGEERGNRSGRHTGLVAEQEDEHLGSGVDGAERSGDRRRAARAELAVLDDVEAAQVDGLPDRLRAAAQDAEELVERAGPGSLQGVIEERRAAVGQQLLRLPETTRPAGGEHETGDPRVSARRHRPRAVPRRSSGTPRSRSTRCRR